MISETEEPDAALRFLADFGLSKHLIKRINGSTRLFHDLGIYGDDAEELLAMLNTRGVDVTEFTFDTYFPREFEDKTGFLAWITSFMWPYKERSSARFKPITIHQLNRSLLSGKIL